MGGHLAPRPASPPPRRAHILPSNPTTHHPPHATEDIVSATVACTRLREVGRENYVWRTLYHRDSWAVAAFASDDPLDGSGGGGGGGSAGNWLHQYQQQHILPIKAESAPPPRDVFGKKGKKEPPWPSVKITVAGHRTTGKTSVLARWAENTFGEPYCATQGMEFKIKWMKYGGEHFSLMAWDLSGGTGTITIGHSGGYRMAQNLDGRTRGLLLVYAKSDRDSFDALEHYVGDYERACAVTGRPMLALLATKADLLTTPTGVSTAEGKAYAAKLGCPYLECSAKTGEGVDRAMGVIARLGYDQEITLSTPPKTSRPPRAKCAVS